MFRENLSIISVNTDSGLIRQIDNADHQVAVAVQQNDQANKVRKIARGLIKAQKADKENYLPFDSTTDAKLFKGKQPKSRLSNPNHSGIGLDNLAEISND